MKNYISSMEHRILGALQKGLLTFKKVSLAYHQTRKNWQYNSYTTAHDKSTEEVQQVAKHMRKACVVSNYSIQVTEKELKKFR